MTSRMDEFRTFVQNHHLVRDEVKQGKRTWQNIYEEWVLLGEDDPIWNEYKTTKEEPTEKPKTIGLGSVKEVITKIQKIDPDNLNKTLNSVQKVIQIAQTVTGPKAAAVAPLFTSAYSDWWD